MRSLRAHLCTLLLFPIVLAVGCEARRRERPVNPIVAASEQLGTTPTPLAERMAALTQHIGSASEPVGEPFAGELIEGRIEQRPYVLVGTYCYTVLAAGDENITELNIEMVNNSDVPIMADRDPGGIATLGVRDSLCPMTPEPHHLRISSAAGSGAFEVRVYRTSAF